MRRHVLWAAVLAAVMSCISGQALCLLAHCARPLFRCEADATCRAWLGCTRACKDQPCQMRCGDLYTNDPVSDLSQCLIGDWHCVPQQRTVCSRPAKASVAEHFRLEMLTGQWFITAGWNPLFDCFDCQNHTFTLDPASDPPRLRGTLKYRVKTDLNCTGRACRYLQRSVEQSWVMDPSLPGHLQNYNNSYLHYADDWYILAAADSFVLVYYCGCNDAWCGYGGSVLYTRSPTFPPSIARSVAQAVAAANVSAYDFNAFCRPDNVAGCDPRRVTGEAATSCGTARPVR